MSRKTTRITSTLMASGLVLAVGSTAIAQPGWQPGGQYGPAGRGPVAFSLMDANADGVVSTDEHAAFRAERIADNARAGRLLRNAGNAPQFTDLDADGDGQLTQAEVARFRSQRMVGRPCNRGGRSGWGGGR